MSFLVTLSNASYQTITVDFSTADLTALVGDNDYKGFFGDLYLRPGTVNQCALFGALPDSKFE